MYVRVLTNIDVNRSYRNVLSLTNIDVNGSYRNVLTNIDVIDSYVRVMTLT